MESCIQNNKHQSQSLSPELEISRLLFLDFFFLSRQLFIILLYLTSFLTTSPLIFFFFSNTARHSFVSLALSYISSSCGHQERRESLYPLNRGLSWIRYPLVATTVHAQDSLLCLLQCIAGKYISLLWDQEQRVASLFLTLDKRHRVSARPNLSILHQY